MNENIQMLIDYIKMHSQFVKPGGLVRMGTPGNMSREQRRIVQRALPNFVKFVWHESFVDCTKA